MSDPYDIPSPNVGDPFREEHFFFYMKMMHELRKKQPHLSAAEIMWFTLQNIGEPFTRLSCDGGEWVGYKKDIELPTEGPPLCPNGHRLDPGPSIRLGWIPDGVVDVDSGGEEGCSVYYEVDFGQGPVDVRCTETGQHKVHTTHTVFR